MGFHAKGDVNFQVVHSSALDLGAAEVDVNQTFTFDLPNGTGNSQANQEFTDTRSLALSTAEDLDLSGAALKDGLNNSLAFTAIRAILVHAWATNGSTITVKPGASNGFLGPFGAAAHKQSIPAGGWWFVTAPVGGWAVVASTGDLLNIGNDDSGGVAKYDIFIAGN